LVEVIEVDDHPWFVGVQYHPELKSRPTKAHPLFRDFIGAAVEYNLKKWAPPKEDNQTVEVK
jgi:CTP synthase